MRRALVLLPCAVAITAVAEVAVFVAVSRRLGVAGALLLVLLTSLLGVTLLRRETARVWRRLRTGGSVRPAPAGDVADGLVGIAAGLLLAVPGLVTSAAGALLALPPARRTAADALQRRTHRGLAGLGLWRTASRGPYGDEGTVIDGEIVDPDRPR